MHSVICSDLGSLECFVITKCTKFGQLIIRKIIKIVATRCQILRLKCTKFDFDFPDHARGAYSAPRDPLAGSKGPTSKGREGRGRKGRGRGKKGKGKGKGEGKGEGRGKRSPCSDFTI